MKKVNFMRTLMSIAFAMLVAGVFGQVANSDYSQYDTDKTNPDTTDYVTLKTGGTTMGYYAEPDPYYHPNYTPAGSWALTSGFTWVWVEDSNPGSAATVDGTAGDANYVEITYPVVGDYEFYVNEVASSAYGGCTSADSTVLRVTVADPPTAQFDAALVNDTSCGDQPAQSLEIDITEDVPVNWASYAFSVTEVIENIDLAGNNTATISTTNDFVEYTLAAKLNSTDADWGGAQPDYTYTFNTSALALQNSERTRYTYTLAAPTGATGTGIVSAISHKSDYLDAPTVNAYAFGSNSSLVYIVNPTPETGPIYHIPNEFQY